MAGHSKGVLLTKQAGKEVLRTKEQARPRVHESGNQQNVLHCYMYLRYPSLGLHTPKTKKVISCIIFCLESSRCVDNLYSR